MTFCNADKRRDYRDHERTIYGNNRSKNAASRFVSNYVSTAKYTVATFLPKNLFEQFRKLANVYFLLISVLQQIPDISPTGKYTTAGPLLLVLMVTAMKAAYEDWQRHKQDKEVNNRECAVLRVCTQEEVDSGMLGSTTSPGWHQTLWSEIQVGDIVQVKNKEPFPADLLLLSSSGTQGICYIETSQLDGETNLKIRQALPHTLTFNTAEALESYEGSVVCEGPNEYLYAFTGTLTLGGDQYPLDPKQILLRGAVLRNTQWAIGEVIYSGHETKQLMNASGAPHKRTLVERTTNTQIIFVFFFLLLLAGISTLFAASWNTKNSSNAWYLEMSSNLASEGFRQMLTFIILYNNLIPISLYVTIEMVKFAQAILINSDSTMYYEPKDTPANARTSDLNEELGQVEYIFSDKTGTLTRNLMEFRKVAINGQSFGYGTTEIGIAAMKRAGKYVEGTAEKEKDRAKRIAKLKKTKKGEEEEEDEFVFDDPRLLAQLHDSNHANSVGIDHMLTLLSVCHTVIPEHDESAGGKLIYQASSPDESALVQAAKYFGYAFTARTPDDVGVEIEGRGMERYEMLNVLEFTSTRKRMSVIVRTPQGRIVLMCKGADTVIFPRLKQGDDATKAIIDATAQHLVDYATEGLRTLVCASREVDPTEYVEWSKVFKAASITIKNREEELSKAADMMEKDLTLVGATAIEDKLQEGVPDAIATLAEAGIKIWVLTGDKQETAINIGFACALLTDDMNLIIVNEETEEETIKSINAKVEEMKKSQHSGIAQAIIIDGHTMTYALSPKLKLQFLELCKGCRAVVCCRVSPAQKAAVVTLAKEHLHAITLAIGDGANDVAMIQAAHVGVGISGEEGLQAARSADYSIAQFKYLKRLLLVHGRFSYRRISKVILYSFYKNICLYMTQCWFTFMNGFSGQTLYEKWSLAGYNVFFASLPVVALGILDQDISVNVAEDYPQLYQPGQRKELFNFKVFWKWVLSALLHSLVVFWVPMLSLGHDVVFSTGHSGGMWMFGFLIYSLVVVTVNLKIGLETSYWTKYNHLVIWGSIIFWFLFNLVYGVMYASPLAMGEESYWVLYQWFESPYLYLVLVLVSVLALMRDFTWKYIKRTYFPEPYHIVQELSRVSSGVTPKKREEILNERASAMFLTTRRKATGFAFEKDEANTERIQRIHREGTMVGLTDPQMVPVNPNGTRKLESGPSSSSAKRSDQQELDEIA